MIAVAVQATEPEFNKECAMGLAMKKAHPHRLLGHLDGGQRQGLLLLERGRQVRVPEGTGGPYRRGRDLLFTLDGSITGSRQGLGP
jgi:hypothetical protein